MWASNFPFSTFKTKTRPYLDIKFLPFNHQTKDNTIFGHQIPLFNHQLKDMTIFGHQIPLFNHQLKDMTIFGHPIPLFDPSTQQDQDQGQDHIWASNFPSSTINSKTIPYLGIRFPPNSPGSERRRSDGSRLQLVVELALLRLHSLESLNDFVDSKDVFILETVFL